MTFLNPLVLFGLAAAAIPVILHLLNLRKLRTIEFSTLAFLKELQQTKIRRLKIRQLLLLLVRTLLVIAVVLAFARPALHGSLMGHIGTNAHSTVVLILDDSFSMQASDARGELFKQAREAASQLIDLLNEGDEAFLVKLSDVPAATVAPATHDFNALRRLISESRSSTVFRTMDGGLRLAARLLAGSRNANKEVYIISDFQRPLFPPGAGGQDPSLLPLFEPGVKVFTVRAGAAPSPNTAVDSVEVTSRILEKEKPAHLYVSVRNFSDVPMQNSVVSVFMDETRAAQANLHIEPWSSGSLTMTVVPKKAGFLKGRVELEDDELGADNKRYFSLTVPERIGVELVAASDADIRFPLLALQSAGGSKESPVKTGRTTPQKLSLTDLRGADVIMLVGLKSFSLPSIDLIRRFVEGGGGLIVFPDGDFQPDENTGKLLEALSIPPVEGVLSGGDSRGTMAFHRVDLDHPLFETVFEKPGETRDSRPRPPGSPEIVKCLKRQAGKHGRSIISMGDGSVFLSEHTLGEGKILMFSVAPVLSWSDFPLKGIFAPLVHRAVVYTSSRGGVQASFRCGDEATLKVPSPPRAAGGALFELVSPDGMPEGIVPNGSGPDAGPQPLGGALSFGPKRLASAGIYELRSGALPLAMVPVNIDAREADCRTIAEDELQAFWNRIGVPPASVRPITDNTRLVAAVTESRFGVELWKHCLVLALLLAVSEMLIARDSRKEAQQLAPAPGI